MSSAPAPIRTSAPAPAPAPTDAHAPASAPCYTVQRTSQTPTMALTFISKVTFLLRWIIFLKLAFEALYDEKCVVA